MVYVGKKGDDAVPEDEMRIPLHYSGNAFDRSGGVRRYDSDGEALRHAEELFRRGYVFEDSEPVHSAADAMRDRDPAPDMHVRDEPLTENAASAASGSETSGDTAAAPASASPREQRSLSGLLGGVLGRISAEEILIGALILMLLVNGTDDELLIMLAILLFC